METLEQKIDRLKAEKTDMESQENFDINVYNEICNDLSAADFELLQAQEKEQRVQEQQQKIELIDEEPLPYDFDDEFTVPGLNDIIRLMLKDRDSANYAEFNAQIDVLHTDYQGKLSASGDRELQLQRQNNELQKEIQIKQDDLTKITEANWKLKAERDDFETKLYNATNEIDRLNSHIDDLQQQLANAPAPSASHINVTPSAALDELVQKAKSIKEKSVDELVKAYEERQRAKQENGGRYVITPPQLGGLPEGNSFRNETIPESNGVPDESVGQNDQSVQPEVTFQISDGIPDIQPGADEADSGDQQPSVGTLEEAFRRIEAIEEINLTVNNALAALANRTGGLLSENEMKGNAA